MFKLAIVPRKFPCVWLQMLSSLSSRCDMEESYRWSPWPVSRFCLHSKREEDILFTKHANGLDHGREQLPAVAVFHARLFLSRQ